jgi:hypothetical protein
MSVKWRGKEVESPFRRKLLVGVVSILVPFFLVLAAVLLIVLLPIMLVLHPVFRLFGLVGTIRQEEYGKFSIKLDRDSFRRR